MDDDLIAFIKARLDEDEAIARAAGQDDLARTWTGNGNGYRGGGQVTDGHWEKVVYDEGAPDTAQALHIARHDPARALREVAAKRRIVDDYRIAAGACFRVTGAEIDTPGYRSMCAGRDALRSCVVQLAAVYSGHPDCRDEWRP